jgi:hypothetical protein
MALSALVGMSQRCRKQIDYAQEPARGGVGALMRELWNLYGEAVEATQLVDVDDMAAIPDALDGLRLRVGLRPDGVIVAVQAVVGLISDLETPLSLFSDRDIDLLG